MPGMQVEDNLVDGWTAEDKRSLLDLVTGGKYSEAKDLPPLTEVIPSIWGKVKEAGVRQQAELSKEIYPGSGITDYDILGTATGAFGATIRTASTASKLFIGWRDNLWGFMTNASRRDYIIREASKIFDADDIKITKHGLNIINKEFGLTGKVVVPEIKGAAGGKMRQAAKTKGRSTIQKRTVESPKRIEQREAAKKAKKESKAGGEPRKRLVREY